MTDSDQISISGGIHLPWTEVQESFTRATGPGGQNVNKVETAVELRLDVAGSPSLPDWLKARLRTLAGRRMTSDGVLVLLAQTHRSQQRNREDVRARLVALLEKAAERQAPRRPTRPTLASKARRVEKKAARGQVKKLRGRVDFD